MSGSFRRAQLQGSEELFRPSRPEEDRQQAGSSLPGGPAAVAAARKDMAATSNRPDGRLVRLTDEEIEILADAVQRLKYPTNRPPTKPPMDVFERLEELRQKLLEAS
jgi:hypothetical protein